jgi:hypothetical protein
MSCPFSGSGARPTRRRLLIGAGGALASVNAGAPARAAQEPVSSRLPFFGPHQGGIATPQQ